MIYLSLFSGAGGGDLGMQWLLGFHCAGYVDWDDYCCKVLERRIQDGFLSDAPIFHCDIREWIKQGYAKSYKGMVDLVTAGFPCQPHSVAGKKLHHKDPRNMWPATIEAIQVIRPQFVLLENVPGIRPYLPVVIRDLRRAGYTVKRPTIVAAAAVGAGHIRKRIWIYAYLDDTGWKDNKRQPAFVTQEHKRRALSVGNEKIPSYLDEMWKLQQERGIQKIRRWGSNRSWWQTEPGVMRVVYGISHGMDRIGALGNAQVPLVAATAWKILAEET